MLLSLALCTRPAVGPEHKLYNSSPMQRANEEYHAVPGGQISAVGARVELQCARKRLFQCSSTYEHIASASSFDCVKLWLSCGAGVLSNVSWECASASLVTGWQCTLSSLM